MLREQLEHLDKLLPLVTWICSVEFKRVVDANGVNRNDWNVRFRSIDSDTSWHLVASRSQDGVLNAVGLRSIRLRRDMGNIERFDVCLLRH